MQVVFCQGDASLVGCVFCVDKITRSNSVCAPRTLISAHIIIQYNIISLFHSGVHRWFAVDATAVTVFGAVHTRKQAA